MSKERVRRRLAAILASDVVGYSRLMEKDEAGTLRRLKALRADILHPGIVEYGGRVVKTTGDGTLVEFASAVDAVQYAIDVQQELRQRNAGTPDERRLDLRIGINLGDVIIDDDDIYGDGVNVAARLENICDPGSIALSGIVYESVRNKLTASFVFQGERSVKNIADPVRVYSIALADSGEPARLSVRGRSTSRRPAIAVLPFDNMSGDREQDYFADGLTEDIITALSSFPSFPVIARNSSFAYKGKTHDVRKIGEALGARYVVEGSVRKSANRIRVTAQLVNAETGHHVWAERYDRDLEDIFAVQDEITCSIAAIVEPTIERTELQKLSVRPPTGLAPWEYCLRGYGLIYAGTLEANGQARKMFERAIALDPTYARAYSGLANTYVKDIRYLDGLDGEAIDGLNDAARRAVALDGADSEARTMLSAAYLAAKQYDAAYAEARRAVELNPNRAFTNNVMGGVAAVTGRFDESIPWLENALKLNPIDPQNYLFYTHLALGHLGAGRQEDAARNAREAVRLKPDFGESRVLLASALGYLGRKSEAIEALGELVENVADYVEGRRIWAPVAKERVLDGLKKAGLTD